jgi:hypothetical protein
LGRGDDAENEYGAKINDTALRKAVFYNRGEDEREETKTCKGLKYQYHAGLHA